jgi:hypothetical protein
LIPGGDLLEALEVCAELVGGGDQLAVSGAGGGGQEQTLVISLQIRGHHVEQPACRRGLDGLVRRLDLWIEVLHRRRKAARENFARIVIEREKRRAFGVDASLEQTVSNHGQRMGHHGHPQAALLNVLGVRVVHQAPAPDEAHPREIREEMADGARHGGIVEDERGAIDQLTPAGRRLYERDVSEAKRLLAEAGFPQGFKTTVDATLAWSPDYVDALQVTMSGWKEAGIDAELKSKDFGAYMATTIYGKFDKLAHGLRGGSPIADIYLYNAHIPGEPLNASGVDDPKLTDMIRLQRRTLDAAKRREIVYDIQRYLAEQAYYAYGPSVSTVAAWEPHVKNFAPNIGQDYGGRLMAAWLSK